jgi:pyruvate/2-oxoglutarate dehydrogenase complex dihydrolipoamide dehydrogenase (E3) component
MTESAPLWLAIVATGAIAVAFAGCWAAFAWLVTDIWRASRDLKRREEAIRERRASSASARASDARSG